MLEYLCSQLHSGAPQCPRKCHTSAERTLPDRQAPHVHAPDRIPKAVTPVVWVQVPGESLIGLAHDFTS